MNACRGPASVERLCAASGLEPGALLEKVEQEKRRLLAETGLRSAAEAVTELGKPERRAQVTAATGLSEEVLLLELARHEQVLDLRFGRYEAVKPLGRGGLGDVYLALDPELKFGPLVAVKTLRVEAAHDAAQQAELRERFLAEGRRTAALAHPNIVRLHETGVQDGKPFLVLEYLERGNLQAWTRRHRGARPEEVIELFEAVLGALEHAHAGLWHGDLSPGNVLFDRDERPKLADFGMAHELPRGRELRTLTGPQLGTLRYTAPEQLYGGKGGPPSDLFAAGVLLHEVLSRCEVDLGRRQHDAVVKLLKQACSPEVARRPSTAAQMASALRRALRPERRRGQGRRLAPLPEELPPEAGIERLQPLGRSRMGRRGAALASLAAAALAVGAAGYWLGTRPEAGPEAFFRRHYPLAPADRLARGLQRRLQGLVFRADLDGDERLDLVAVLDGETGRGRVVALHPDGRLRWERPLGRELRLAEGTYSATFYAVEALPVRLASGGPGLAVLSLHDRWWPCQVLVLDGSSGEAVVEYIHAGHMHEMAVGDLDGDGADEVLSGGTNNRLAGEGMGAAVLDVLGTGPHRGRSPGAPEPEGEALPLGLERAYLRFPRSDVARERLKTHHSVSSLVLRRFEDGSSLVEAAPAEVLTVRNEPGGGLYYSLFAASLLTRGVALDSGFPRVHAELVREGKLRSRLDEGYFEALMAGIRYWDGRHWLTPGEWKLRLGSPAGERPRSAPHAAAEAALPLDR